VVDVVMGWSGRGGGVVGRKKVVVVGREGRKVSGSSRKRASAKVRGVNLATAALSHYPSFSHTSH